MNCFVKAMEEKEAKEVCRWNYEEVYGVYNMEGSEESMKELLNGTYYSVTNEDKEILGFFCFGQSAQVPAGNEYGVYLDEDCLDIGLGMRPDLCGQGRGKTFIKEGLEFASKEFSKRNFRLTVAAFNERAIKVYENAGFKKERVFQRKNGESSFEFITMKLTIE